MSIYSVRISWRGAPGRNGRNGRYRIHVRQIQDRRVELRNLNLTKSKVVKDKNHVDIELFNVILRNDYGLVYCASKVIQYCMEQTHGKTRYISEIQDFIMNEQELISCIEQFQSEKKLGKNIKISRLEHEKGGVYFMRRIYPEKLTSGRKYIHIVYDAQHVWIHVADKKRAPEYELCSQTGCGRRIVAGCMERHRKGCDINASRHLDNFAVRELLYPCAEYTLQLPHEIDFECSEKYRLIEKEVFSEGKSVFLHGPGGNGKTYLINRLIQSNPSKTVWVNTPTGISALDYSRHGKTWHSRFGYMQIGGIENVNKLYKDKYKFKRHVAKFLKNEQVPDLIVFEESSMIKGRDFKFMSEALKVFMDNDFEFGGVPIIVCGDPGQLEPVCHDDELADLYFASYHVSQIRMHGLVVELNHPRRLMKGVQDPVQLTRQFNVQLQLRMGKVPLDLFNIVATMDTIEFGERILDRDDFLDCDDLIVARSHRERNDILKKLYAQRSAVVLGYTDSKRSIPIYVEKGTRLIVTDNQAVRADFVKNGTWCYVVDYEEKKWVKVRFENDYETIIYSRTGKFDLDSYHVRTVHKVQGMTIQSKLYFYNGIDGGLQWSSGLLYTVFSRCTNMENITIVSKPDIAPSDWLNHDSCWTYESVCQVIRDPKTCIAMDRMVGCNGKSGLPSTKDASNYIRYRDRRIIDRKGVHADYTILENEYKYNNTLNIDHETRVEHIGNLKKHVIALSTPIWFFQGRIEHFHTFMDRNRIPRDHLPMYRVDGPHMVFSNKDFDDPGQVFCLWLKTIFEFVGKEAVRVESDYKNKWASWEVRYFYITTMRLLGFNNLGYDDFFFIQEFLKSGCGLEPAFVSGGGSNLKKFSLGYVDSKNKRIALESFDLMQVSGPGSLAKHIDSSVMPNLGNPRAFMSVCAILWGYGESPSGPIYPDGVDWSTLTNTVKRQYIWKWYDEATQYRQYHYGFTRYELRKECKDKLVRVRKYYPARCQHAFERDLVMVQDLSQYGRKGCTALKLYTQMSNEELRASDCIDLLAIMDDGQGGLDWSRAFFPREIPKAKEMLQDKGEGFFRNYNLYQEVYEYAKSDVRLNHLLLCIVDNSLGYYFGKDCQHFQFENSWGGMGISLMRFSTTSELSLQNLMTTIKPQVKICKKGMDMRFFYPRYPIAPLEVERLVKGICGGKTQARRIHGQASQLGEYFGYFDNSGMYMHVQRTTEYPYGDYTIYTRNISHTRIAQFEEAFRDGQLQDDVFTRCRFFEFRGKCHSKEVENVIGVKGNTRLEYTNEERVYCTTNYGLKLFKLFDGQVLEILTVVEFEHQCRQFQDGMAYLSEKKRNARDDVEKNSAKLLANAAFGTMNKKDKPNKVICVHNSQDLHLVYDQHPSGIKNLVDYGNYHLGIVEDGVRTSMQNPSYIGAFTLDASKLLLYEFLYDALGGKDRLLNYTSMCGYGDTDSVVLPKSAIDRIVALDKTRLPEDRWFYEPSMGMTKVMKDGKYLDELADDANKYFGKDYVDSIDKSFPTIATGYHARVVEFFNPQSKSGGNMFIVPPVKWNDGRPTTATDYPEPGEDAEWLVGYKCFAKGVAGDARIYVQVGNYGERIENVSIIERKGVEYYCLDSMGHNEETYKVFRHAYMWSIRMETERQNDVVRKLLFVNSKQQEDGAGFADIVNIKDTGRSIWGGSDNGRVPVMKEIFKEKSIQEWARNGFHAFDVSDGYSVPYGYSE